MSQERSLPRLIYIYSTVKGLTDPRVSFAVLKQNPIPDFRQYLATSCRVTPICQPDVQHIYTAWDRLFAELEHGQHFFLYAWSSVLRTSPQILCKMGLSFVVATPGPLHVRWLTTRPLWYKGELVAWCEPIDMRHEDPAQVQVIVLSEERLLHLNPDQ